MTHFALRSNDETDSLRSMEWDWQNRRVRLSVGELARFSLLAGADSGAGRWRAELGQHWHSVLRRQAEAGDEGWSFEQPVKGRLQQDRWTFDLAGRIDQFRPDPGQPLVREVKTISINLPVDTATLRDAYPQHCHQAMIYAFLLSGGHTLPAVEVLFIDIQSGISQALSLDDTDWHRLQAHLAAVARTLETRRGHFARLRKLEIPRPFAEWRVGQPETRSALKQHLETGQSLLLEAPTGFGKTALVMEQGLRLLAGGKVERILLLTGRNTGHEPLLRQLAAFKTAMPELAVHALRSRKDHALDPAMEDGMSYAEMIDRWLASGLSAESLLLEGIQNLETVRLLGQRHGIPPWALSRMLLPAADVWVADFNYLFDPGVSGMIEGIPTYHPERTLLIVDEAHNLPDRVAASHSHAFPRKHLETILTEVQFARFPGTLPRLLDQLVAFVRRQAVTDQLDPPDEADFVSLLREIAEAFLESRFDENELSDSSRDWLWSLPLCLADWDHPDLPVQLFCPSPGRVEMACLDASRVIGPVLRRFHQCLLMSATLRPWEAFQDAIGIDGDDRFARVVGDSPWLMDCFEVIADARVDTRYRHRDRHLDTTLYTIGETALDGAGCMAVFFPSYRYAEQVLERMPFRYPSLRCALQPRDLALEQQQDFLRQALLTEDVLLLVLGSRFSEGIDALGGEVTRVIVVSPALPEFNALQRAREARFTRRGEAFRRIYLMPGMRKISQALGRLVRDPRHRARVLLHGRRFAEAAYQDLLPDFLQPSVIVENDRDFRKSWLDASRLS
jgi:Rad3-related DNA helicase